MSTYLYRFCVSPTSLPYRSLLYVFYGVVAISLSTYPFLGIVFISIEVSVLRALRIRAIWTFRASELAYESVPHIVVRMVSLSTGLLMLQARALRTSACRGVSSCLSELV